MSSLSTFLNGRYFYTEVNATGSIQSGTFACSGDCDGNVTVLVSALTPNTNYTFYYEASNSAGSSPRSDTSYFATQEGSPEAPGIASTA